MIDPLAVLNSLPGKQVEQLVQPVCNYCCQPIYKSSATESGWGHSEPCDWDLVTRSRCLTVATPPATPIRHVPRVVVGSPAYQKPEIPSDADKFAAEYVRKYALEQWVADHIALAYMFGRCAGLDAGQKIFNDCIEAEMGGAK